MASLLLLLGINAGYSSHLTMNYLRAGAASFFRVFPALSSVSHVLQASNMPLSNEEGGQADSDFMPEKLDGKMTT